MRRFWVAWVVVREVFCGIICGKGLRMLILAIADVCVVVYTGYKLDNTTGTEHAVYVLTFYLVILGATWHIHFVEKDRT